MPTPFIASRRTYHRRRWGPLALTVAIAGLAWALARSRPFRVEVAGTSMAPELLPGDWLIATASRRSIRRDDVVVVRHPHQGDLELVKRVVAGPGDEVAGRLLGSGEWFVTGDNADASTDSRRFGPVSQSEIVGRVRFVYWPPERIGPVRSARGTRRPARSRRG
jgi:nickel-type superoxide dismutase maturation protease